jgi:hypothetical protein
MRICASSSSVATYKRTTGPFVPPTKRDLAVRNHDPARAAVRPRDAPCDTARCESRTVYREGLGPSFVGKANGAPACQGRVRHATRTASSCRPVRSCGRIANQSSRSWVQRHAGQTGGATQRPGSDGGGPLRGGMSPNLAVPHWSLGGFSFGVQPASSRICSTSAVYSLTLPIGSKK